MKPYADVTYYKNCFAGKKNILDIDDLNNHLKLASQKIDEITYNRIIGKGFSNLTMFQQKKIKDAVCHQANYIFKNKNNGIDMVSYSVLDINVSVQKKETEYFDKDLDEAAWVAIKQTGLSGGIL